MIAKHGGGSAPAFLCLCVDQPHYQRLIWCRGVYLYMPFMPSLAKLKSSTSQRHNGFWKCEEEDKTYEIASHFGTCRKRCHSWPVWWDVRICCSFVVICNDLRLKVTNSKVWLWMLSGTHKSGRLNFVRWRLLFVGPQYESCLISSLLAPRILRRLLDFWKFLHPCNIWLRSCYMRRDQTEYGCWYLTESLVCIGMP